MEKFRTNNPNCMICAMVMSAGHKVLFISQNWCRIMSVKVVGRSVRF